MPCRSPSLPDGLQQAKAGAAGIQVTALPMVEAHVKEACGGMERALRTLCSTRDTSRPRPERAAVAAACQLVKLEASKLALLYCEPGAGGVPEAHGLPLVGGLQSAVCALCSLLEGAAARGGPTLRRVLEAAASAVVAAASALARGAVDGAGGRPGVVVHLAGVALASSDDAARVPLDNRIAIGREVTKGIRQLMDGVRELAEAASGEGEQPDTDNGAGAGTEAEAEAAADADLDFFGGQGLSPEEAAVASAASALLVQAAALVRVLARALVSAGAAPEEPACREAWESSLFHLRQLVESADELASCAMCPHRAGQPGEGDAGGRRAVSVLRGRGAPRRL